MRSDLGWIESNALFCENFLVRSIFRIDWTQTIKTNIQSNRIESTEWDRMPWIGLKRIEDWIGLNASNRIESDRMLWIGPKQIECIESDRMDIEILTWNLKLPMLGGFNAWRLTLRYITKKCWNWQKSFWNAESGSLNGQEMDAEWRLKFGTLRYWKILWMPEGLGLEATQKKSNNWLGKKVTETENWQNIIDELQWNICSELEAYVT